MQHSLSDNDSNSRKTTEDLGKTTLKVYRYLYRNGKPLGIRDIQRGLGLSSSSVAEYHVRKLLSMSLVKEESESRFLVDRLVFENMIRIRNTLIPIQVGFSVFFGTALLVLLFLFRPSVLSGQYIFSVIMIALACSLFAYQAFKASSGSV